MFTHLNPKQLSMIQTFDLPIILFLAGYLPVECSSCTHPGQALFDNALCRVLRNVSQVSLLIVQSIKFVLSSIGLAFFPSFFLSFSLLPLILSSHSLGRCHRQLTRSLCEAHNYSAQQLMTDSQNRLRPPLLC